MVFRITPASTVIVLSSGSMSRMAIMRSSETSTSWPPRRGGAGEPVVDRLAEAMMRDRRNRNRLGARGIELMQHAEQIGRGLDKIAAGREIAGAAIRPETEKSLAIERRLRIEAQSRPR